MATKDIFNPSTQQIEPAELTVDQNNEIVAEFSNGHFLKFPAGLPKEDLELHIEKVQEANEGQEIITEEYLAEKEAEREASLTAIGEITQDDGNNTTAPKVSGR